MLAASSALTRPGVRLSMQNLSEPRFSAQYRRYHHFVGHALRRVGVPEADVDDLSQEVFLVLLRNLRDLSDTAQLMPWLRQVARRVASNHRRGVLRRQRRQRHWSEPTELDDPERELARAEAAGFLADFFDGLDPQARSVFLLSEVEGLSGPQIAEQLGLNLNTTYSRIRSVRRRFNQAVDRQRQSSPAWLVMLPSLVGPSASGPAGWIAVALRTTATQKLLGVLIVLVVAVGLATLTRGSCSLDPQGPQAAPIGLEDHRARPGATPYADTDAPGRRLGATVTGRVEDLTGASVPGAEVCIVREAAAPPRCVLADDQGVYSLPGALPGAAWVGASARGYVAPPVFDGHFDRPIRIPATGTLTGIDLLLRTGGRQVSGRVRDMAGGPIEGATVVALRGNELLAITRVSTDPDGRFSIWVDATSYVSVLASAEGYVTGHQQLFRPAGDAFDLALFPEAVIEGRVVDAKTGAGVSDLLVEAPQHHAEASTARTDERGRFRLTGLHPGRYKPRVRDRSWLGHATQAVALELGETIDDVVVEVHGARRVSGHALRGDGKPCTAGRVTVRDASGEVVSSERPDPLGAVDIGGLLPGEYTVVVSCTMSWEGAPGQEFTVDLLDADVEDAE
ncbi:MAG: sigma-70 family RNA polymerase sigma factor [Myxococcota bacterium]